MADPKAEVIGIKAQAFRAAELMQHLHGHMAAELAVAALQQQRQPGAERIGPQAPQAALRHFTQLAGIVIGAGPFQLQREAVFQFQQSGGRALPQLLQRAHVQAADLVRTDVDHKAFAHRSRRATRWLTFTAWSAMRSMQRSTSTSIN